ncbi:MAG: cysteine desulfurase [Betaproteobacteria bacterium]|nr:cysteine desulfurase [Betaproteobacteria bacterium]
MHEAPIYLDYNATTPVDPRVVEAMLPYLREHYGNPSSDHVYGRRARTAVEAARAEVAALIGAQAEEIVFTGSATEANNLALQGVARARLAEGRALLVTSSVEHPSVARPMRKMAAEGWGVTELPVDAAGRLRLNEVANGISPDVALVSVMLANNEVGTLQPIREIAALAHEHGTLMHVDAAQAAGKIPVDVNELGVDLLTLAGHKFYAPKGIGVLYVRRGTPLQPIFHGAGHERGLRPGTENVPHIVALGEAARLARIGLTEEARLLERRRDALQAHLTRSIPGLSLNGHASERLPNTLNLSFPGVQGWQLLAAADEIAAATGSACHAGEQAVSGVLAAMGCTRERALGAVRLSLGRYSTDAEIDQAATALIGAWRRLAS